MALVSHFPAGCARFCVVFVSPVSTGRDNNAGRVAASARLHNQHPTVNTAQC